MREQEVGRSRLSRRSEGEVGKPRQFVADKTVRALRVPAG